MRSAWRAVFRRLTAAVRGGRRRLPSPVLHLPAGADGRPARAASDAPWRGGVKRRVAVVLAGLGLWVFCIQVRLVQLQVVRHRDYVELAARQQEHEMSLPAERGNIVDRDGRILAYSVDVPVIVANPADITDAEQTMAQLCGALGDCTADRRAAILRSLTRKGSFAYVDWEVSEPQRQRVADLELPGILIREETHRYYPKRDLAAHVLGYVGTDNKGLAGVENAFDEVISGRDGLALVQRDARRQRMDARIERPPTPGATLELTLDLYLQHIAERELSAGIAENRAEGGAAVIMDPFTGEILALASYPTFNPNDFGSYPPAARRNRAIQDVYEPGSTFKIVTASAALENHVFAPDDLIDTSPGVIRIGSRRPITEAGHHDYGTLTFEQVIVKSSNIGAIKIGLQVGAARMSDYMRRFGFGQVLSPDFRGSSAGIVYPEDRIDDSGLASMAMGYQVSVTPLQMATAVSAVANGGTLYQPHVVRAVVRGGAREAVDPRLLRRATSAETAATLTTIMEGVVQSNEGTARAARLDGYRVAGKTGTANKAIPGGYSATDFNASFVGFVPSRRPVFTILVVVDSPHAASHFGGTVAAPIFKRIAEAALREYGVPRTINPRPPLIISAEAAAASALPAADLLPAALQTGLDGHALMPDVRGLAARDALRVLAAAGLSVRLSGSGFVADQTPAAGEPIEEGGRSALELRRTRPVPGASGGRIP